MTAVDNVVRLVMVLCIKISLGELDPLNFGATLIEEPPRSHKVLRRCLYRVFLQGLEGFGHAAHVQVLIVRV